MHWRFLDLIAGIFTFVVFLILVTIAVNFSRVIPVWILTTIITPIIFASAMRFFYARQFLLGNEPLEVVLSKIKSRSDRLLLYATFIDQWGCGSNNCGELGM